MVIAGQGTRRSTAGALLAAAILAGASGCGSEDSRSREAVEGHTPKQATAAELTSLHEAADNSEDLHSFRYRITGRAPQQGEVDREVAVAKDSEALWWKDHREGAEARITGGAMYMDIGAETAAEAGVKRWTKIPLTDVPKFNPQMGLDAIVNLMGQQPFGGNIPASELTGVQRLGTQTIHGVQTIHYRGTASVSALPQDSQSRQFIDTLDIDEIVMEIWIDAAQDRVKQLRMRGPDKQSPFDTTVTLLAVNEPVSVQVPPAEQTRHASELF